MKTRKNLESIRIKTKEKLNLTRILVCAGTGCHSSKSDDIIKELEKEAKKQKAKVTVEKTGCFGFCAKGPIVAVLPDETFYELVKPEDAKDIVASLIKGEQLLRLLPKENNEFIKRWHELKFYKKQQRVVLKNCGIINPEKIDEYLALNGYKALEKVLNTMSPNQVIEEISASGIRGRGGAGFPTGRKWTFTKMAKGEEKYVCCNADEGDPGAFMNRSVLEGDPHSVIEAMIIAGYTIGAKQGYIYIRAEYPIAVDRLNIAIDQAREYGLLGKNILGTDLEFDIELKLGAGAFVCGEETALMTSVEGKRGEPRPRPPFPANKGVFAKPTLLNNVETLSTIPQIILKGANWYSSIGTEKSKGTKVFALGGNVRNVGLVEVPMGTTLREIVFDIGGGIPGDLEFKAAQTGGPSGGCIPKEYLDTPIDYEHLKEIGSMMGSGGIIVMDENKCMVNIAKFFLEFIVDESCGKCTPCRIGTKRMYEILHNITEGKGKLEDLDRLEQLADTIRKTSLCGLGQTAPNPVISTLKYFRDEYIEHIEERKCRAGECKKLSKVTIDQEKCKKCGICAKVCPSNAIQGEKGKEFKIDQDKCTKCLVCIESCPFKAISK